VLVNISANIHDLRVDITRDRINTLSEQTRSILRGLKEDVHFGAILEQSTTGQVFKRAMEQYSYYTNRITYDVVDRKETKSRFESITASSSKRSKQLTNISEDEITGAIVSVSRASSKKIGFILDHGETSINDSSSEGASFVVEKLRGYGYEVSELSLLSGAPLDRFSLLMLVSPTKRISDPEINKLKKYIKKGGNIIVPSSPPLPGSNAGPQDNVNLLTAGFGVVFDGGVIIDPRSGSMGLSQAVTVVRDLAKTNLISSNLKDPLMLPYSQSLSIKPGVNYICRSSASSWLDDDINSEKISFDEKKDKKGPLDICSILCVNKDKGCLLAVGNSTFISNKYINYGSNYDLIMNAISFLLDEKELALTRTRMDKPGYFNAGSSFIVGFFAVYLIPSMMLIFGVWSYYRRRRK